MGVQRLSHIGICVSDLERSLHFYRDLLGFKAISDLELEGEPAATLLALPELKLRAAYLARDGTCIELLHYPAPGHRGDGAACPMNRLGFTHLSLRVDDVDALAPRVEAAGGRVLAESRIEVAGTVAVFVTDPDGLRIELIQQPGDPTAPPRP